MQKSLKDKIADFFGGAFGFLIGAWAIIGYFYGAWDAWNNDGSFVLFLAIFFPPAAMIYGMFLMAADFIGWLF